MAANDKLRDADVLVLAFEHVLPLEKDKRIDPVWEALCNIFSAPSKPSGYTRNAARYLTTLRAHKLYQEDRDSFFLLHPETSGRLGRYFFKGNVNGRKVLVFQSLLRLNTDGPDMPVFGLMKQVIEEVKPRMVVSVGLGAGVLPDHQVGDVVVCAQARLRLNAELETSERNGQESRGIWNPTAEMFAGLQPFAPQQEPQLVAPSPNYDTPGVAIQPAEHVPQVRIGALPVLTAPRVSEHAFEVGLPTIPADKSELSFLGEQGCATDMDYAPVAQACGTGVPCGAVLGLAVPAIHDISEDNENALRDGWIEFFTRRYARAAAGNAATVAHHLASNA